jgi:hypothetical protein
LGCVLVHRSKGPNRSLHGRVPRLVSRKLSRWSVGRRRMTVL